jgi:hypothetical protein
MFGQIITMYWTVTWENMSSSANGWLTEWEWDSNQILKIGQTGLTDTGGKGPNQKGGWTVSFVVNRDNIASSSFKWNIYAEYTQNIDPRFRGWSIEDPTLFLLRRQAAVLNEVERQGGLTTGSDLLSQ